MNMLFNIIAIWFSLNALLFAWLAFGRYVEWSDPFHPSEVRRLR